MSASDAPSWSGYPKRRAGYTLRVRARCARGRVVSAATLRRDLRELEEQGLLVRTHGGARALDPSGSEIPVRLRDHRMVAIKRRIAQHAAALRPAGW